MQEDMSTRFKGQQAPPQRSNGKARLDVVLRAGLAARTNGKVFDEEYQQWRKWIEFVPDVVKPSLARPNMPCIPVPWDLYIERGEPKERFVFRDERGNRTYERTDDMWLLPPQQLGGRDVTTGIIPIVEYVNNVLTDQRLGADALPDDKSRTNSEEVQEYANYENQTYNLLPGERWIFEFVEFEVDGRDKTSYRYCLVPQEMYTLRFRLTNALERVETAMTDENMGGAQRREALTEEEDAPPVPWELQERFTGWKGWAMRRLLFQIARLPKVTASSSSKSKRKA